jgi:hypothetical protein
VEALAGATARLNASISAKAEERFGYVTGRSTRSRPASAFSFLSETD